MYVLYVCIYIIMDVCMYYVCMYYVCVYVCIMCVCICIREEKALLAFQPYETAEVRFPGSQLQLQLNDWFATNVRAVMCHDFPC